jgi:hypothetical protein
MNEGKSSFSQLIDLLPDREFRRCVVRYGGDRYTKTLFCWEQFIAMAFAQLAYRESLRDIEACLSAVGPKLYHMGFGSAVARSTLANANENRDWRIFADFAQVLICTLTTTLRLRCDGHSRRALSVCVGLDHHRSLSGAVSLGQIPQA